MNLLIVELDNEGLNLDMNAMNLEVRQQSIEMPICKDELYNLIVCKDCGIGLPFEWIPAHHYSIKALRDQVLAFLGLEDNTMTIAQAENWIQSMWVGRVVQNIPVIKGYICNECHYSGAKKTVMKNHFFKEHNGLKMAENSEECKVQLAFKAGLRKYIQVEEYDEMEVDIEGDSDWKGAVEMDFAESMANIKIAGTDGHGNLRLMNVFIAKTRWDIIMEEKDLKDAVILAGAPPSNQNLHKVILCGRRYIYKTCEVLDKGSVIIKRLLISGGYFII